MQYAKMDIGIKTLYIYIYIYIYIYVCVCVCVCFKKQMHEFKFLSSLLDIVTHSSVFKKLNYCKDTHGLNI